MRLTKPSTNIEVLKLESVSINLFDKIAHDNGCVAKYADLHVRK